MRSRVDSERLMVDSYAIHFLFSNKATAKRVDVSFYAGRVKPLANYSLMNRSETKKYVLSVRTGNSSELCLPGTR